MTETGIGRGRHRQAGIEWGEGGGRQRQTGIKKGGGGADIDRQA